MGIIITDNEKVYCYFSSHKKLVGNIDEVKYASSNAKGSYCYIDFNDILHVGNKTVKVPQDMVGIRMSSYIEIFYPNKVLLYNLGLTNMFEIEERVTPSDTFNILNFQKKSYWMLSNDKYVIKNEQTVQKDIPDGYNYIFPRAFSDGFIKLICINNDCVIWDPENGIIKKTGFEVCGTTSLPVLHLGDAIVALTHRRKFNINKFYADLIEHIDFIDISYDTLIISCGKLTCAVCSDGDLVEIPDNYRVFGVNK